MDFNESPINSLSILEEVSVLGSCFLNETGVYFLIAFGFFPNSIILIIFSLSVTLSVTVTE